MYTGFCCLPSLIYFLCSALCLKEAILLLLRTVPSQLPYLIAFHWIQPFGACGSGENSDWFFLILCLLWHCLSGRGCISPCLQILPAAPLPRLCLTGSGITPPLAFGSQGDKGFLLMVISGDLNIPLSVNPSHSCKYCFILVSSAESFGVKFCLQPAS